VGLSPRIPANLRRRKSSVILSEASANQRAAFGALNKFSREPKDLHFPAPYPGPFKPLLA
jgi:hypothetical protein